MKRSRDPDVGARDGRGTKKKSLAPLRGFAHREGCYRSARIKGSEWGREKKTATDIKGKETYRKVSRSARKKDARQLQRRSQGRVVVSQKTERRSN